LPVDYLIRELSSARWLASTVAQNWSSSAPLPEHSFHVYRELLVSQLPRLQAPAASPNCWASRLGHPTASAAARRRPGAIAPALRAAEIWYDRPSPAGPPPAAAGSTRLESEK
jgi:hypothetical protein